MKLGVAPSTPVIDSRPQPGQATEQAVWRDPGGDVRASITREGLGRFRAGVGTRLVSGPVTDAAFDIPPPDGTIAVDTANKRLYVRIGGSWKYSSLT